MHAHLITTSDQMETELAALREENQRLKWNEPLNMLNSAGLHEAIRQLKPALYTIVFADVNRLKHINSCTGSHIATNRYLRDGLRVRRGELAGQYLGDEFIFILPSDADAPGFCARLTRQLASQPLSQTERMVLEALDGPQARLSATFAWEVTSDVWGAIERLSMQVLALKAKRDGRCA